MNKPSIHTVPHGDGWANRTEGATRLTKTFDTQAQAQAAGREAAVNRGVEHYVHGANGAIRERNTYPRSADPRSSKG